jgi:outer membrane protein insertion porin family
MQQKVLSIAMPGLRPIAGIFASLLTLILLGAGNVYADENDFGLDLPVVDSIVILGNRSFNDGELKKRMRTKEKKLWSIFSKPKYRRDFLRRDIESIRSFYLKNGFFSVQVRLDEVAKDEEKNSVMIRILINEGPQTTVRSLSFTSQDLIKERELRKGLQLVPGIAFNENILEVDRFTLYSKFFEDGYLAASVTPKVVMDSISVDILWELEPSIPVRIDSIRVSGNVKVKEHLVRRELIVEPGEYFRLSRTVESKQNLYNTGFFNSVEIDPYGIDLDRGIANLDVQVRERKMGYIEAGFGVGNVHPNRVFGEWGQRNLLGRGYTLNLGAEFGYRLFRDNKYRSENWDPQKQYEEYSGVLAFPHIFGTWNTFATSARYTYDATVEPAIVRQTGLSLTLARRFSRLSTMYLSYSFENIKRENVIDEKESSRRRAVDLNFRNDTRDFFFNPTRGTFFTLNTRVAGGLLGGGDDYYSIVPTYREYKRITGRSVFAWRARFGYARAFGGSVETGVPIESRFFAGGANSVRGYRENTVGPVGSAGDPAGGDVILLANAEWRYPLPWLGQYNFGGVFFLDAGNVWSDIKDIAGEQFKPFVDSGDVDVLDFKYSLGFGIRYYTPVGPIRLDFGYPIKLYEGQEKYRIHISLGQIF